MMMLLSMLTGIWMEFLVLFFSAPSLLKLVQGFVFGGLRQLEP
jgi:hypothetical protein